MYAVFPELSSGMKIFAAVFTLTDGMLLMNDEAFIFCTVMKKSILSRGIRNAITEDVSRKNLLPT